MDIKNHYTFIGSHHDLENPFERALYRFFEIIPGFLVWATLLAIFFFSWYAPTYVALFIIIFDLYWAAKTIYFSFHLRSSFRKMQKNINADWRKKLDGYEVEVGGITKDWRDIRHLVILPFYKEGLEIVRPSFLSLAHSDYPLEKMFIVLTVEEKGGEEAMSVAREIEKEFSGRFGKFLVTAHPAGLTGEIPGKGSNETWGVREAKEKMIDPEDIDYENVLVSVFDVDTVVMPGYFSCLTYYYLVTPNRVRASYQPVPLFTNNIWEAPALARVIAFSSTMWHMIQQERPERQTTFSSHSMSFKTLVEIGFWQTNIVSEDSRIFWQCFLHYNGDYRVVPLFYPVFMDANVASTFWRTMVNQYKQQRRWAWGAENLPYIFFGFWKNKAVPLSKKIYFIFYQIEGFHSWATNALIIFLLGWLPLVLGGDKFTETVLSHNLPTLTRFIMVFAMVGVFTSAAISISFLPPRPPHYGRHHSLMMVLQWLFLPIVLIVFGSLPPIESQTRLMINKRLDYWTTEKVRRGV